MAYESAKERFAALGVDTERAIETLSGISLSLHCWQADDVVGYENLGGALTGGIQVTGNYPVRPVIMRKHVRMSVKSCRWLAENIG